LSAKPPLWHAEQQKLHNCLNHESLCRHTHQDKG
jgi:hypothetical protein